MNEESFIWLESLRVEITKKCFLALDLEYIDSRLIVIASSHDTIDLFLGQIQLDLLNIV